MEARGRQVCGHVRHPGDPHLHGAHPHGQLTAGQVPVAIAAEVLAPLVALPPQKGVHLVLERGREHLSRPFSNHGLQRLVDPLHRARGLRALVCSCQGVSLPVHFPTRGCVLTLEGYAFLYGQAPSISTTSDMSSIESGVVGVF